MKVLSSFSFKISEFGSEAMAVTDADDGINSKAQGIFHAPAIIACICNLHRAASPKRSGYVDRVSRKNGLKDDPSFLLSSFKSSSPFQFFLLKLETSIRLSPLSFLASSVQAQFKAEWKRNRGGGSGGICTFSIPKREISLHQIVLACHVFLPPYPFPALPSSASSPLLSSHFVAPKKGFVARKEYAAVIMWSGPGKSQES